jgi:hypothetical protein
MFNFAILSVVNLLLGYAWLTLTMMVGRELFVVPYLAFTVIALASVYLMLRARRQSPKLGLLACLVFSLLVAPLTFLLSGNSRDAHWALTGLLNAWGIAAWSPVFVINVLVIWLMKRPKI